MNVNMFKSITKNKTSTTPTSAAIAKVIISPPPTAPAMDTFTQIKDTPNNNRISKSGLSSLARSSGTKYVSGEDNGVDTNEKEKETNPYDNNFTPPKNFIDDLVEEVIQGKVIPVTPIQKPNTPPNAPPNADDGFPSNIYSYLSNKDREIISCVSNVLEQFIPIITLHTFKEYNDRIQNELAEAAALALYKNAKVTELCNDTNKIISEEQSINTPTVNTIIDCKVNDKVKRMTDQLTSIQRAHDKALRNLKNLQELATSSNTVSDASRVRLGF